MTIHLVADWSRVLRRAWSMWLAYAAVAVLFLDVVVDWGGQYLTLPPRESVALRIASLVLMILAIPARIILQRVFHDE